MLSLGTRGTRIHKVREKEGDRKIGGIMMANYKEIRDKYVDYDVRNDQEIDLLDKDGNVLDTLYIHGLIDNFINDMVEIQMREEARERAKEFAKKL